MHTLILVRHGQSAWNKENRFTGWTDVDLSEDGKTEAETAAGSLIAERLYPDIVYTSILKRGIRTAWIMLDAMDRMWVPVEKHWRLNERHYGGLQGLNKSETAARYGEEQVHIWRRSYDVAPPPLSDEAYAAQGNDPLFSSVPAENLPRLETLKDTVGRTLPYWTQTVAPVVRSGKTVAIAGHHNSLRALVKELEHLSDEAIVELTIPTGIPLVYRLDDSLNVIDKRYLATPEKLAAAIARVVGQGKALT
jgi:2,3-bisphosphoglycerate-dependent phosphoglycerate mutase